MKPLGRKNYGSIPHLPDSRKGPADKSCHPGQARIATEQKRDKHDVIIVQEKLDGSNVGVCKVEGEIHAITRAGWLATTSPFEQHHIFHDWVQDNYAKFDKLLLEGERVAGEWLAQAHGTRYDLFGDPFVAFDLIVDTTRASWNEVEERCLSVDLETVFTPMIGDSVSVDGALYIIGEGGHGAIDTVEGAVWRVERKGIVDFIVKYVRPDKIDGVYFPQNNGGYEEWNWHPETSVA